MLELCPCARQEKKQCERRKRFSEVSTQQCVFTIAERKAVGVLAKDDELLKVEPKKYLRAMEFHQSRNEENPVGKKSNRIFFFP